MLAVLSCGGGGDAPETRQSRDPAKERIRNFWRLNREANRLRLDGDYKAAVERYRQCLELDPAHEDSLYYLAATLEQLGEYRQAEVVYRRMIENNPESNRAVSQLAALLALRAPGASPNPDEALSWLERSIAINREHSGPYLSIGRVLLDEGRFADAFENFETAAQFGSAGGRAMAAYALLLQGKSDEARRLLQSVLASEEKEKQLAARGGKQEGDTAARQGAAPAGPLRVAAAQARFFLAWISARGDGSHSRRGAPVWRDVTRETGLPTGGRAAWGDFDGDGLVDVLVTGPKVQLYRNRDGRFEEVTSKSGLNDMPQAWDACWGDYDSDGDLDLYVIRPGFFGQGLNQLFRNDGGGSFADVTAESGLQGTRSTARASFVDFDTDGDLDLVEAGAGADGIPPLRLYQNQGQRFAEVGEDRALNVSGAVTDFAWNDYDGDNRLDLFVLRWRKEIQLYRNSGRNQFEDVTQSAGLGGIRGLGFSSVLLDFDRDGREDILITAHAGFNDVVMAAGKSAAGGAERSTMRLFRNVSGERFEEIRLPGLNSPFGVIEARAADVDGDGWDDLVLANGGLGAQRLESSVVLRNHTGKAFREWAWLPGPKQPAGATGVSLADIDRDGRPEIYLAGNHLFQGTPFPGGLLLRASIPDPQ